MKKYLLAGVLVLLFAMPLTAAEKESVKIKLPDGIYMYDSSVQRRKDGTDWVGFGKYFIVKNNTIYGQREAVKKFGFSKLNEMFSGNRQYKILLAGEKIGSIYISRIDNEGDCDEGCIDYKEALLAKDIKEGPAYVANKYSRAGSAVKCLAVPEAYKEVKKKVYTTIPQEEVDKIAKLAKEKLFDLVKNRKEVKKYKVKRAEIVREGLYVLDKISYGNGDVYIGIYYRVHATAENTDRFDMEILFSATKDRIYVIASQYDDITLIEGSIRICGMIDVDGDGCEELIIEKEYYVDEVGVTNMEIYTRIVDGSWILIKKAKD